MNSHTTLQLWKVERLADNKFALCYFFFTEQLYAERIKKKQNLQPKVHAQEVVIDKSSKH